MEIKLKLIGTLFSAQIRKTTPCLRKNGQSALRFLISFLLPVTLISVSSGVLFKNVFTGGLGIYVQRFN